MTGITCKQLVNSMVFCALGSLVACGNYQAPISEQGRNQVVQAPEIISSNAGNEQSRVQPQNSAATYSSAQPDSRIQISSSSNRPATARVSTPTTSPVSQGGITRRAIGESSSPGFSNTVRSAISRSPQSGSASAASRSGTVAGSALSALNPVSHLVQAGDTLFSIAYQYNLDFRTLAMANGLNPPYTIFVGQELDLAAQVAGTVSEALVDAAGNIISNNAPSSVSINSPQQPVSVGSAPVQWQWPHRGRILNSFQSDNSAGIDISGNVGDPVLAAGDGDVVYSGRGVQGSGNLIIIRHSDRLLSAYAHNSAMLVPEGQRVMAGQQIAEVGVDDQGVAMLHFEIRRDGASVDPLDFLPRQ